MKLNHCKSLISVCTGWILALTCTGCGNSDSVPESITDTQVPQKRIMVTLGDSIAEGYGLTEPETTRYSALLTEALNDQDTIWEDYNYAVSGDTSTQMLQRLENGRAVRLPSADVITVCIGANHLLQPFVSFYGTWLITSSVPSPRVTDAFYQMEAEIEAGLTEFETQLPLIYDHIRDRNPDAQLIFLTVYNPFAHIDDPIELMDETIILSEYSAEQITRCNDIIREFAATHDDITIADIYTAFGKEDTPPILGEMSTQNEYFVDPHPDTTGHQLIADTIRPLISTAELS